MLDPEDPLVQAAVFGKQVQEFLQEDIGNYLVGLARDQGDVAMRELKTVDPTETERIIALQMRIQIADNFIQWLAEAVAMGLQAQQTLEGR
jgi:hypothetical protein